MTRIIQAATITDLTVAARGHVIVSGSHGGRYPGYRAAQAQVRAVIFNDAGGGHEDAGIASLADLAACGIAAATVGHMTARIGDPADMLARGVVSHANAPAQALGVAVGMACADAAERLREAATVAASPAPYAETRHEIAVAGAARPLVLIDSAAMTTPEDAGAIIVTGSHGGLVGGDPALALRVPGRAGVFNDAGIGRDEAGIARLPALETRGIAAFAVAASSARIGEAVSTYRDGVISAANAVAQGMGAVVGRPAKAVIDAWAREAHALRARSEELKPQQS